METERYSKGQFWFIVLAEAALFKGWGYSPVELLDAYKKMKENGQENRLVSYPRYLFEDLAAGPSNRKVLAGG